jgi:hypothetical protein
MENIMKSLETEMRLLAHYNMRNHVGAKALAEDNELLGFYHLLYRGMKKEHGEKLPSSLISNWAYK